MASGVMRPPDDSGALSVELSIDSFEVDLRTGRAEIGNWLTSTVTIRRIDDTSFEFIAEGDRLIFLPEDPDTFGEHPAVSDPADMKRRERRRDEKDAKKQAKQDEKEATQAEKEAEREARKADKEAKKEAKRSSRRASSEEPPPARPSPAEQESLEDAPATVSIEDRAAALMGTIAETAPAPDPVPEFDPVSALESAIRAAEAIEDDEHLEDDAAVPVKARRRTGLRRRRVEEEPQPAPDPERLLEPAATIVDDELSEDDEASPDEARRRIRLRRRRAEESQEPAEDESVEDDDELNRLWIRAIDVARKYDILGLDRVPIDEELRGQDHEHTWDHRVAWKTGPGARICTICGKVRSKTEQAAPTDVAGMPE
ncbi:MAG: hypothetical protein ABFR89_07020 [Actinomycetota bacterium]